MPPPPQRTYVSPLRQSQADATRRAIVLAAAQSFTELGYSATTISGIAALAAVSRRTVFSAVGGKAALLKLAWEWAVAGDDQPVMMADRAAVTAMLAESDPHRLVTMWVAFITEAATRSAALSHVVEIAADVDLEVAELRASVDRQRHTGATSFIEHLARQGDLRPGVSPAQAVDWCWAHMTPTLYRDLVLAQGWPMTRYLQWLTAAMSAMLLP